MLTFRVDEDLELFLLQPHHAEAWHALIQRNYAGWYPYLPHVSRIKTVADAETYLHGALEAFVGGHDVRLGIRYRGEFIGRISYGEIDTVVRKCEIGYQIDKDFEGKGIITRCTTAMIDYAFSEMGMERIVIMAVDSNRRSRAVPERLGFTHEATLRRGEYVADTWHDLVVYGLLKDEWRRKP